MVVNLLILILISIIMLFMLTSSIYWFPSWVIMELMGFIFMMILSYSYSASVSKKVCMWKYFLFQCIGSLLFLTSMFMSLNHTMYYGSDSIDILLFMGLVMKLGLPPFHKWSFEVSENLDWTEFLLINSIQKVPPIILTWKLIDVNTAMVLMYIIMLVYSTSGLFDWSLRRFLIYSSIMNYIWVMSSSMIDSMSMILYLSVYLLTLASVILMLKKYSFLGFSFLFSNNTFLLIGTTNIVLSINIMSLSGLPPLAGFVSKYDVMVSLIYSQLLLALFLMVVSLIMLLMYMIIMTSSIILNKSNEKWMVKKDYFIIIIGLMNLLFSLIYFM